MNAMLVAWGVSVVAAVAGTWQVQDWRHAEADLERVEMQAEARRLNAKGANLAATTHEGFKERERVVFQTITESVDRIVERPVYRHVCFDADGLRELNAAIGGGATDSGEPGHALP